MPYRKVTWKRNLNAIPASVRRKVDKLDSKLLRVATSKKIPFVDIQNGKYKHLGLRVKDGAVVAAEPVLPPTDMGRWSERNITGWDKTRRDLPMIPKTYTWETPNFGDPSRGTHMQSRTRMVYQKEVYLPQHMQIGLEILSDAKDISGTVLVKFEVMRDLDAKRSDFERDLLWCLNLLQENAGVVDLFPSSATRSDFIKTISLDWEIFPPGTSVETILKAFKKRVDGVKAGPTGPLEERIRLFSSLGADATILKGQGSFDSYVGAKYFDDLVVFENVKYGNALYVLYEDWKDVSKRSRLDLLKGTDESFDRFVHTDGWEGRFKAHIRKELKKRGKPRSK